MFSLKELFSSTRDVLVIDYPSTDVPEALVRAGFDVVVSGGPNPEDHTHWELDGDAVVQRPYGHPPDHADLVWSFRPINELAGISAYAKQIGARAVWLHSGYNERGEVEPEGVWLTGEDTEQAIDIVEGAGLAYVESPYIVDAVRELRG
jgi:DNA-binding transcriptional LysR family regulator